MDARDTFRDVKIAGTLSEEQKSELMECLQDYREVFTNVPGRTSVLEHRFVTTSDIPVRQKPYQIPHTLRDEVKNELSVCISISNHSKERQEF
jgi:hypothetical protein